MSMSSWRISSSMLMRSAASSSTISRRLTRGSAYCLIRSSAAWMVSVVRRLGQVRERAALDALVALLLDGDDLHRDVAGVGVLLEPRQHRPAEHVGQEHVERDRGRPVFAHHAQAVGAAIGDQHLEAARARQVAQHRRVARVVLDHQQRRVARHDLGAIVGRLARATQRPAVCGCSVCARQRQPARAPRARDRRPRSAAAGTA